ncbi:Scr1 family TA system antitoxin-like transcriptional regulator [Lentzea sp. NPDC058436]|uniref:Scr1 family TA system antitoxin-like transcriptional regulator n=1 Tax=Lentzea sp. NPDC058436 TaxID=3346499 RepID=UPI00365A4B7E
MPKNFKSSLQNRAVGRALARWRADSGMSLSEVTKNVGWSTAKTSMLQNGLRPIPDYDVLALALVYGVSDRERRPVLLGAQRAHASRQFELLGGETAACVAWTYAELESEASYERVIAMDLLPPVVRSPEYEAALRRARVSPSSHQDRRYYSDADRSQVMSHIHDGPSLCVDLVIGEAVLRRPVGGHLVAADQLLKLAALAALPGVRVQLAADIGTFAGIPSFTIFSFREEEFDDVVYLDTLHNEIWLEHVDEVLPYTESFTRLMSNLLSTDATIARIFEAAQKHKDAK